jgi:exopolysaccharide biosynthesis polyprenyl glycosylphosphotransferase
MLWEKEKILFLINRITDLGLTVGAFIIAYYIRVYLSPEYFKVLRYTSDYKIVILMVVIIWYLIFEKFHIYSLYQEPISIKTLWKILQAVSLGMLALVLFMYLFSITTMSRFIIGLFYILNISLICLSKFVIQSLLQQFRQKEINIRKVFIVGSKTRAQALIESINAQNRTDVLILGCLDVEHSSIGNTVAHGIKVIDTIDNMEKILSEKVVDELIFTMPLRIIENIEKYIHLAETMGISIRIIPDFQIYQVMDNLDIGTLKLEDFNGVLTMSIHTTPVNYGMLFIKGAFDYLFAAIALCLFFPIFLVTFIAIKSISPGPVLFKQERCGLSGRRFKLYKFRTMVTDAEARRNELEMLNEAEKPVFKVKKDPRIIPFVGTFLRRTSLDELPQLINVLKGDMSFVGPRPPLPNEVAKYELWQRRRLSMKPGLTCFWQVSSKRNEIGFKEWMDMDLGYIDNWSLVTDFKILLATFRAMLIGAGR